MLENLQPDSRNLRRKLASLIRAPLPQKTQTASGDTAVDLVITLNEINDKHGTGALVKRIFEGSDEIFSLRSRNDYGADHQFGKWSICASHASLPRTLAFQEIMDLLAGKRVRRIVCVPYIASDLLFAIAAKEIFEAPLCLYLMDDQNVAVNHIDDGLMREFLSKCTLRFTTHAEMRDAYESKHGFKFYLLPAVVPSNLVCSEPVSYDPECNKDTGALVGSIWIEEWFTQLIEMAKGSGTKIHWFGNNKPAYWVLPEESMNAAGISAFGILPEPELARRLKTYPFALVPTGRLEDAGNARALGDLSLPGRILFISACSNTPVLVLGHEGTPAAKFVRRFGIGTVCPYDGRLFRETVAKITDPGVQKTMRANAAALAPRLSAKGVGEWLWRSLEKGEPDDSRFEDLMPHTNADSVSFIEPPVPSDLFRDYAQIYQAMKRLKSQGFEPDFVVDVGASSGVWSDSVGRIFPESRFILVDPLASRYAKASKLKDFPKLEILEVALSNQSGTASLQVPADPYGASLLCHQAPPQCCETVTSKVTTLDAVAAERKIKGKGLLKLDVQFAEHLVLEGGKEFLKQVDAVVLEISLLRFHPQAKVLAEMVTLLAGLGFRYYDDAGYWRAPADGVLLQKDVVFVREPLFTPWTQPSTA